jgi:hypothetical protein
VPTDTDYAMDLIAQRVAAGQDVKPSARIGRRRRLLGSKTPRQGMITPTGAGSDAYDLGSTQDEADKGNENDWVRSAVKAASSSRAWMNEGVRIVQDIKVCHFIIKRSFSDLIAYHAYRVSSTEQRDSIFARIVLGQSRRYLAGI